MASLREYWRDISPGSPFDTVTRYNIDTDTDTYPAPDVISMPTGTLGPVHPPVGTVIYSTCVGLDRKEYKGIGSSASVNIVTTVNSPSCCTYTGSEFTFSKTNNTDLVTPNGTITVVSAGVEDINDFEASIDGGGSWISAVADQFLFEDLPGGSYSVIVRFTGGVCTVTGSVTISDIITYPPLIITETTLPALYSPVFHPIELGYLLDNNDATVKNDMSGVYLEVTTDDARDYLLTLPIIRIIDNADYAGTYQVTSFDDSGPSVKFYFNGTYVSDQAVLFVPFDRQVFQLFCEVSYANFQKIADITAYPDALGKYTIRVEGFLQAAFLLNPPANFGDEITLLRKYYVIPRDFDLSAPQTTLNAVYSAIEDLGPFLGDLIPLGPAPIQFINEKTSEGMKVLFSFINTTLGRVQNITSSDETDIVSTSPVVYLPALPLSTYDLTWINPAGAIGSLNITPALPDWITLESSPADTVKLTIHTYTEGETGDYEGDDYDGTDYLTGGPNAIVGCYTFEFKDGATLLFTLTICVYPISKSDLVCEGGFNIAWINREGGWSSYYFTGRRVYGKAIGEVKTFKKGKELKRSSVENVYNYVEVVVANKAIKDLEFIASLKQSIQAYLYSDLTGQWSIPIVLDAQSGSIYETPFKQINQLDRFVFRYAEEVTIQTQ